MQQQWWNKFVVKHFQLAIKHPTVISFYWSPCNFVLRPKSKLLKAPLKSSQTSGATKRTRQKLELGFENKPNLKSYPLKRDQTKKNDIKQS